MAPRPLLAALLVVAFATCHAGKAHTHRPHRRLKKGASQRPPLSGPDLTKPEEGALEEFGTISNEPTKPKKIAPTPTYAPPPLPAPPPPPPTPTPNMEAAKRWADDVAQYGVCLRDFATLVTSDTCTSAPLGDADYFLHMFKQEQFALTAGYKTGMARQGLVIDGLGLDATSDDATPLIRHATQRARVQLAYECAPPESECRSSMVPIQDIDSSVGLDPQCPMRVLQADPTAQSKPRAIEIWMGHPNHHQMVAMRGRASEIARAYSANPATMFWADSPSYAAAVAVCYQVRLHGKDGQATPPGMLLKENIYAMPTTDQALPSLEEEDAGEINFSIVVAEAERPVRPVNNKTDEKRQSKAADSEKRSRSSSGGDEKAQQATSGGQEEKARQAISGGESDAQRLLSSENNKVFAGISWSKEEFNNFAPEGKWEELKPHTSKRELKPEYRWHGSELERPLTLREFYMEFGHDAWEKWNAARPAPDYETRPPNQVVGPRHLSNGYSNVGPNEKKISSTAGHQDKKAQHQEKEAKKVGV